MDERFLLALDLKGAFDNVSHDAIMSGLMELNCGEHVFNYAWSFLINRTATIGLGEIRSDRLDMPNKGTPQRSIVSPLLFNIAMTGLAKRLAGIPWVRHSLYADDVTIWVTDCSLDDKESALQAAASCVEDYAREAGLRCAPEKSELLRVKDLYYRDKTPVMIYLEGKKVQEVEVMRVLGMWLQSNRMATHSIQLLRNQTAQISRMIRRVSNKNRGFKEDDTMRLVKSLVLSRITRISRSSLLGAQKGGG